MSQVLLFHGLTGSPYDLMPVANFLKSPQLSVTIPRLKGHGTTIKDLARVKHCDWIKQAEQELAKLDPNQPIIIGGLSMGALLAILLAIKSPRIDALILLSPAFRLSFLAELLISLANLGLLPPEENFKKLSGGSDIADPEEKKNCPSYKEMSVNGLMQFDRLRMNAVKNLSKITCPVFVAWAKLDGAIDLSGSQQILQNRLKSPLSTKIYNRSKHVITLDFDREKLSHDLRDFINTSLRP